MDYLASIEKALEYIEERLDEREDFVIYDERFLGRKIYPLRQTFIYQLNSSILYVYFFSLLR